MGKVAATDEDSIINLDRQWNEAYPNRDIAALDRIIADDWFCIDGTGRVIGKQELLERVGTSPQAVSEAHFDEFHSRIFGNVAVVTGRLSGHVADETGSRYFQQRFTRIYEKRDGGWQAIVTQVTVVQPNEEL